MPGITSIAEVRLAGRDIRRPSIPLQSSPSWSAGVLEWGFTGTACRSPIDISIIPVMLPAYCCLWHLFLFLALVEEFASKSWSIFLRFTSTEAVMFAYSSLFGGHYFNLERICIKYN